MTQPRSDLALTALRLAAGPQRRHLVRWLRSFEHDHLLLRGVPWITFDACDALAAMRLDDARVFEWGVGGSTLFLRARGARTTSVEHDPAWFAKMRALYADLDMRLVEPAPATTDATAHTPDPAAPRDYTSSDPRFRGLSFQAYAAAIDATPDESFDLILVDGRARPSCILHALPKVKRGGHLLVDDSERPHCLAVAGALLDGWSARHFLGFGPCLSFRWRTSLYVRPSHDASRNPG